LSPKTFDVPILVWRHVWSDAHIQTLKMTSRNTPHINSFNRNYSLSLIMKALFLVSIHTKCCLWQLQGEVLQRGNVMYIKAVAIHYHTSPINSTQ